MTSSGIHSRFTTSPPGSAYSAVAAEKRGATPVNRVSTLLAVYLFLLFSRVLDVTSLWRLHIPLILWLVLTLITLARGELQFAFSSKVTRCFIAFTVWVILCFPFSIWRAASLQSIQLQVQSLVIYLIIVQTVRTKRDWQKIAGAFAYATLAVSLLAFHFGYVVEGRLSLPGGTLGDPNEFALILVAGLPFWWSKANHATGLRKVFFLCCTLPIFVTFARAGSRAGLLAMAVVLFLSFIFARGTQKILIPVLALIAVVAATFLLPGYLQTRFTTIFSAEGSHDARLEDRLNSDIASSEARKALLIQGIQITFAHPIVGVGPGCFPYIARNERIASGMFAGDALVSHNTYTQISSETGLPGFFLFFTTVVLCVRSVLTDYRRLTLVDEELAQYARYLFMSMAALAIGIFFLSVGYAPMTAVIFAFAVALHNVVERSLKQPGNSTAPKAPAWQAAAFSNLKQRPYQTNQVRPRKRAWPEVSR